MTKLEETKNAILDAIIATCQADLGSNAEAMANAYGALVQSEVQERMTAWQTSSCECPECKNDLDDEVIN